MVVGVHRDGAVFGYHVRSEVTCERLLEAPSRSQPDAWHIGAALVELLELTNMEIRLSADAVASIRAGVRPDESAIVLYDWRDLDRPVASFP